MHMYKIVCVCVCLVVCACVSASLWLLIISLPRPEGPYPPRCSGLSSRNGGVILIHIIYVHIYTYVYTYGKFAFRKRTMRKPCALFVSLHVLHFFKDLGGKAKSKDIWRQYSILATLAIKHCKLYNILGGPVPPTVRTVQHLHNPGGAVSLTYVCVLYIYIYIYTYIYCIYIYIYIYIYGCRCRCGCKIRAPPMICPEPDHPCEPESHRIKTCA
jgi:hypothetical protein